MVVVVVVVVVRWLWCKVVVQDPKTDCLRVMVCVHWLENPVWRPGTDGAYLHVVISQPGQHRSGAITSQTLPPCVFPLSVESVCLSVCMSVFLIHCLSYYLLVLLTVCLSICLTLFWSVCLSVTYD